MKIRITVIAALIALFSIIDISQAQAQVSVRIGTPARHHRVHRRHVVHQRTVVQPSPVVVRRRTVVRQRPVVVRERVVVHDRPARRRQR